MEQCIVPDYMMYAAMYTTSIMEKCNNVMIYHGLLTFNLSCSKACQTIGIIYRNFYKHATLHTLLTLYGSLVIPYYPLFGTYPYLPLILKLSRKPNTLL